MNLDTLRVEIDKIDDKLVDLLKERMDIVSKVALLKQENNMPVTDSNREKQIISRISEDVENKYKGESVLLMRTLLALSKSHQRKLIFTGEAPLLPPSALPVTENIICAYQGVPGSWSEQALMQVFPDAEKRSVEYFEDVFLAVKNKLVNYGIVAIENSQTGAIGETYDLLKKYGCFITGRTQVDIKQCLLVPKGTKLSDIKKVLSHPEGFKQCRNFLRNKPWDLIDCRNTAVAAMSVSNEQEGKTAAIGSRRAAQCYGLEVIAPDIMDSAGNKTSFVIISLEPEYNPQSNTVSISFATAHRSGALCEALLSFMSHGINLARIESRPGSSGNYRFFADVEGNITDEKVVSALNQLAAATEYLEVIGCYSAERG